MDVADRKPACDGAHRPAASMYATWPLVQERRIEPHCKLPHRSRPVVARLARIAAPVWYHEAAGTVPARNKQFSTAVSAGSSRRAPRLLLPESVAEQLRGQPARTH